MTSVGWLLVVPAVFLAAAALGWIWLWQPEEYTILEITASREPDLGLPVYAQFVVTQSLVVASPSTITTLVVPMYILSLHQTLTIELQQADQTIQRWRVRPKLTGVQEIHLPLDTPRSLAGQLAILFDGSTIAAASAASSPRLFVESDDAAYPDGHYQIAANAKQGDIALKVIGQKRRTQRLIDDWHKTPLVVLSKGALLVAALLLISALPPLLFQVVLGKNQDNA